MFLHCRDLGSRLWSRFRWPSSRLGDNFRKKVFVFFPFLELKDPKIGTQQLELPPSLKTGELAHVCSTRGQGFGVRVVGRTGGCQCADAFVAADATDSPRADDAARVADAAGAFDVAG